MLDVLLPSEAPANQDTASFRQIKGDFAGEIAREGGRRLIKAEGQQSRDRRGIRAETVEKNVWKVVQLPPMITTG